MNVDPARLRAAYEKVRDELLAERTPDGHWVGELSSSALATATAVSALAVVREAGLWPAPEIDELIRRGIAYLVCQQNRDGGFGDTDLSHSNISTTYLAVAALHLAPGAVGNALCGVPGAGVDADSASPGMPQRAFPTEIAGLLARANAYIESKGGLNGLRERYGIDKTFVVPIMTNLALAGLLDWRQIDPLPFELACVPQSLYRFVGMPVVSYAIPALVAIGQARYFHAPPRNPITRLIRWLSITRSLRVLRQMQPDSGGYLEATPLTAFVVMSLASGEVQGSRFKVQSSIAGEVIREGVKFLAASIREDGSWPIDTNLATWNTTLAINALAGAGENIADLLGPQCLDWLLSCQHVKRHAFTGADPGGFGWSDLSGAVPDADDTPGAILSLDAQHEEGFCVKTDDIPRDCQAWWVARTWLIRLQNSDGGWPTFCKGWGTLPFDRSGVDLTAHAIRALFEPAVRLRDWQGRPEPTAAQVAVKRGLGFIEDEQHRDGSWSPLWFGNQDHPEEDNPVYGTAKVLFAYRDLSLMDSPEAKRGVAWLVANQNADGGWGSGVWGRTQNAELRMQNEQSAAQPILNSEFCILKSSVEETTLAVEALLAAPPTTDHRPPTDPAAAALARGLNWLLDRVEAGQHRQPAPIGFYFAKLWYYERLYPLTFTVAALGRACRQFAHQEQHATEPPSATRAT